MKNADAIIVGAGPAGTTAAWKLEQAGYRTLILEKENFPRVKPCAGWITPEALDLLEMTPLEYGGGILPLKNFRISLRGIPFRMSMLQYSIRRMEFDEWLLRRSGAAMIRHRVERIEKTGERFVVDGEYEAPILIGAGGTSCPVARILFKEHHIRERRLMAVTLEEEFPFEGFEPESCIIRFFDGGMPGYAWVVPKANGYLNVGIGAVAPRLKRRGERIRDHWHRFVSDLDRRGIVKNREYKPLGHAYYMMGRTMNARKDGAYLVGDAAGLASRDFAEGIAPSVESALMAVRSITEGIPYDPAAIRPYSVGNRAAGWLLEKWMTGL